MKSKILFRIGDLGVEEEFEAAKRHFDVLISRSLITPDTLIIPRYSALPYYKELEEDVANLGGSLINDYRGHRFTADIMAWSNVLSRFTPKTWSQRDIPYLPDKGSFILKGETNSKKFLFDTHMYAASKADVGRVLCNLLNDSLISTQEIVVREYVPLMTYMTSFHGLPITKEFRFFILDNKVVGKGYYWASHVEDLPEVPSPDEVPEKFLKEVIATIAVTSVAPPPRFYVLDIAQTQTHDWIVIEMNCGTMSGLSCIDPDTLYKNMAETLS